MCSILGYNLDMTIVVLGPNGFIGKKLMASLMESCATRNERILSITNIDEFISRLEFSSEVYTIIDCVGVKPFFYGTTNEFVPQNPKYKLIFFRYFELLKYCSKTHSRFIFLSSGGTVYGTYKGRPWRESDLTNPVEDYGKACALVEELVLESNGIVVRGSNIYGALNSNKQRQGLITELLNSLITHSEIKITGNGQSVRDYLHVIDFVKGLKSVVNNYHDSPKIINLSSGEGMNQLELIRLTESILEKNGFKESILQTRILSEVSSSIDINIIDPSLFVKTFGELKTIFIENGIEDMMKSLGLFQ
jgi:UDP-glucose 4-epimerase